MDTTHVAEMDRRWLDHVLGLIPVRFKETFPQSVSHLSSEMQEDYHMSVKKAIVDFVLRDPRGKPGEDIQEESEYSFTSLRSSTETWQDDYQYAKEVLSSQVIGLSPVMLEIQNIFAKHQGFILFDCKEILKETNPYELRKFKTAVMYQIESSRERLLARYRRAFTLVHHIFGRIRTWFP
jgi:dynein heavy chain